MRPGERKLVQKIDFFILTFCCLSYFLNYLDRSNLNNAYVSGMKEDLHFHGNQLNQINTVFTVGYIIGQVPSNLALYYIKPRIFFPSMVLLWGCLTIITSSVQHPTSIMAIRFFQGIAESSTFVGTHYILGSWYTASELGKRSGIFTSSGLAGTMISGFIQTGIHSSLDGKQGLAGWRWLFIIDGLITLPVALYGFFYFPDTPSTTTAPYLTHEERELAISRVPEVPVHKPLSLDFLKRLLKCWQCISQLNNYPTGIPAIGILSTLLFATLTDILPTHRYIVAYFIALTGLATSAMILSSSPHIHTQGLTPTIYAAYYWSGAVYACQATFFAWANDELRFEDDQVRSVVIASMNLGSNAVNAWWSILFYGASFAPRFTRGMWAMIGTSIAMAVWATAVIFMGRRERRKRESGVVVGGDEVGAVSTDVVDEKI
ncbi:hypothetical protein EG327_007475 [Venturia inaequalis]|uniref:Major facilitator superfamily (MFS) profile domain-containing protein n=1 Tax=Venturia inaequalis TaxID=5025 RepID=A0A8H3VS78_VENIN|nr:hypothetical protein EG327_007475 [Venturia inaequalis]